jgi:hypothetical protein
MCAPEETFNKFHSYLKVETFLAVSLIKKLIEKGYRIAAVAFLYLISDT